MLILAVLLPTTIFAQTAKSLDDALESAANKVMREIEREILLGNISVAILNFEAPTNSISKHIDIKLTEYFRKNRRFMPTDRQRLDIARRELAFNLSGEVSDDTAQSIGKFVGAQVVVFGSIEKYGSNYRLWIRATSFEWVVTVGQAIEFVKDIVPPPPLQPFFGISLGTNIGPVGWEVITGGVQAGVQVKKLFNVLLDGGAGLGLIDDPDFLCLNFGTMLEIHLGANGRLGFGGGIIWTGYRSEYKDNLSFRYGRGSFTWINNSYSRPLFVRAYCDFLFRDGLKFGDEYKLGLAVGIYFF